MQSCHKLSLIENKKNILNNLQKFSLIISGLCHDVGHTGRTNIFEINSQSKLAIRYNDRSVLENHHSSLAFKILLSDKSNILCNLNQQDYLGFRSYFVQNILYTDIKEHFRLLKAFEDRVKES